MVSPWQDSWVTTTFLQRATIADESGDGESFDSLLWPVSLQSGETAPEFARGHALPGSMVVVFDLTVSEIMPKRFLI